MTDQDGRIAVVTGGGRGLGRAIALGLADSGAQVAVVARTEAQLDETAALAAPGQVTPIVCDVSDPVAVKGMCERVDAELGTATILVNAAGVFWANFAYQGCRSSCVARHDRHQHDCSVPCLPRISGRHGGRRVGAHCECVVRRFAASARRAEQRLWRLKGRAKPIHASIGGRGRRKRASRRT